MRWPSLPKARSTAPDITNHPWHITQKYGFGVNLEQTLARNLTAFARWGWNNGKTESFAYTEIDSTIEVGLGVNGAQWHRKQDRAGMAFVSNAIKKDHQMYLAAGGYGFLIGDGKLNYGRENILETYYTAHVWRGIYLGARRAIHCESRLQPRPRPSIHRILPRPRGVLSNNFTSAYEHGFRGFLKLIHLDPRCRA